MSVIAQYEVSVAAPYTVGGAGATLKYFASNPPVALWNSGFTGVNAPVSSAQIGAVPSATSSLGQLQLFTASGTPAGVSFVIGGVGMGKLLGNRFRIYASGVASSAVTPTILPVVQVNTTVTASGASPTYVGLLNPAASAALVANQPVGWSIAGDLLLDPTSGSLFGFMKSQYQSTATGTAASAVAEGGVAVPRVNVVLANAQGVAGFGLVVGITFGTSDASNSASLYEFKIVQD